MGLIRFNEKLLKRNGELATSQRCCCEFCYTACVTVYGEAIGQNVESLTALILSDTSWVLSEWHLAHALIFYDNAPSVVTNKWVVFQFHNCGGYSMDQTESDMVNVGTGWFNQFGADPVPLTGPCYQTPCSVNSVDFVYNVRAGLCIGGAMYPSYDVVIADAQPCPCPN